LSSPYSNSRVPTMLLLRDRSLPGYGAKVTITPDGGIHLKRGRWRADIPAGGCS
jgi:hypothetical protein